MADTDKFRQAEQLWESGDVEGSINAHLDVCLKGDDDRVRSRSAMILVERLNAFEHPHQFFQACDQGTTCARKMRDSLSEAYLLAIKAEGLAILNGMRFVRERKRLKMAPGWFGFSLERDEAQYEELTKKIETNESEIEGMVATAFAIADNAGSHSTKAQVLLRAARVYFNKYMNLKMDYLKGVPRIPKSWLRMLRPYRLDDLLHFTKGERTRMSQCLKQCTTNYFAAVREFQLDGDELGTAYAYFNLANSLRSTYRFRSAKKYLGLATRIAHRHQAVNLIQRLAVLQKTIQMRNRDTPNYLAGERRHDILN